VLSSDFGGNQQFFASAQGLTISRVITAYLVLSHVQPAVRE
jgi:hypothetical protein